MDIKLLQDFILIFGLASLVNLVFQKHKFPGIIGFLFTGVVVGPYGFRLMYGMHKIEIMAKLGVKKWSHSRGSFGDHWNGINGHNIAHAERIAGIQYFSVENGTDIVIGESEKGELIIYGDGTA